MVVHACPTSLGALMGPTPGAYPRALRPLVPYWASCRALCYGPTLLLGAGMGLLQDFILGPWHYLRAVCS